MCDDPLPYCSRATSVLEAWARGRTTMESMLTWAGSSSVQTDAGGDVVGAERLGDTGIDLRGGLSVPRGDG